jgi:hypothetical protein
MLSFCNAEENRNSYFTGNKRLVANEIDFKITSLSFHQIFHLLVCLSAKRIDSSNSGIQLNGPNQETHTYMVSALTARSYNNQ